MDLTDAERVVEVGGSGFKKIDYSGRHMYGRRTTAVVGPNMQKILVAAARAGIAPDTMDTWRSDALGLDTVVY